MLKYLKERMMPMPEKSEAEKALELTERGRRDRTKRLETEAKAKVEAERRDRLQTYHQRYAAAGELVDQYEEEAKVFDAKLVELATTVEHMSRFSPRHNYLYAGGELTQLTLDIRCRRATRADRRVIPISNA